MKVLQTSALPLGYAAKLFPVLGVPSKIAARKKGHLSSSLVIHQ
jgi:hypothetical protein